MNKKILLIGLIIIVISMSIGYALYSTSLKVKGTGNIDSNFNIEVTGITEDKKEGKAVSITNPTYTKTNATFNTKLSREKDNIEYKVEITNKGSIDGKIENITITNPNELIKVETRGIEKGQIIKSGEVLEYIVRVYIPEGTKINEDITSKIEVNTEIIQDDNQIFNEPIDGIEANKLEIESTIEESDYTSIKCTVNAKGNGLKYSYSLDDKTYTEALESNTYTFTGLKPNTRYTVYYKVEDKDGNYVQTSKWIETKLGPFTITFNYNGATADNDIETKTVNYNEVYGNLPNPKKVHIVTFEPNNGTGLTEDSIKLVYKFYGWYLDENYSKAVGQSSVFDFKENITLYAKWSEEKIILPTITRTGYNFKGWYNDATFNSKVGNSGEEYFPKTSETLYAKFLDEKAPTNLVITNTSNGAWTNQDVTVTLSAQDDGSGIDHYEWYENGAWTTRAISLANNKGTILFTGNRNETLRFRAVDKAGNISSEGTTAVKIDKTNPTVTFGTNGGSWAKSRSTTVSASDTLSGVSSIKYQWSTSTTAPTSFSTTISSGATVNGSGVTGTYYLWVQVTDKAGNVLTTKSNAFYFDNTKPTISLNPNTQASYVKSKAVTVNLADANSGLPASQKIYYAWSTSNSSAPSFSSYLTTTNTAGATSTSVTVPATSNSSFTGTYYLWIKAATLSDSVGNTSNQVVSALFKFDNTVPTGSIAFTGSKGTVSISNVNNENVYVTGTSWGTKPYAAKSASDSHSGVKSSTLSCSSNNTNVATVANAAGTTGTKYEITIKSRKGSANIYHYLQEAATISCSLTVTDNAGNSKSVSASALAGNGWYTWGTPVTCSYNSSYKTKNWAYSNGLNHVNGWVYTWNPGLTVDIYYYTNSSGTMLRDWQKIDGYWYYLNDWCSYRHAYKTNSNYNYPDGGMIWNDTLIRVSDNSKWTFNGSGKCTSGSGC